MQNIEQCFVFCPSFLENDRSLCLNSDLNRPNLFHTVRAHANCTGLKNSIILGLPGCHGNRWNVGLGSRGDGEGFRWASDGKINLLALHIYQALQGRIQELREGVESG